MNLFKKTICFGDIHFGLKHNSPNHNKDCIDFLSWMCKIAKEKNAETCIFLGDFCHHRNSVNTHTLNFMIDAMRLLSNNFEKVYMMVGNHDMYWRESRDIHSLIVGGEFSNIILVDNIITDGNVTLAPWLVDDEWKSITKTKSKYLFGHLELPGFKMNAQVEMPDHGNLNATHFKHQDYVFSGHFHIRQIKGKINYIGNPFGHNYSDVWDFDRGAMFLEWGKEPVYLNYEDGPRFISINLSALLSNPDIYLKPKTHLQVILDIDITYEEAAFLRETFLNQYSVREFKLIRNQDDDLTKEYVGDISLKTVDQIVVECLNTIDSDSKFDIAKFIEIYNGL